MVWTYPREFINGESRFNDAVCIYHRVFINGKGCFKVKVCICYHVFISSESHFKGAEYRYHRVLFDGNIIKKLRFVYHHVVIKGKVILKLRYVYLILPLSKEKSCQTCGMFIDGRSNFKLAECIYHHGFINGKRQFNIAVFTYLTLYHTHQWKGRLEFAEYISSCVQQ